MVVAPLSLGDSAALSVVGEPLCEKGLNSTPQLCGGQCEMSPLGPGCGCGLSGGCGLWHSIATSERPGVALPGGLPSEVVPGPAEDGFGSPHRREKRL